MVKGCFLELSVVSLRGCPSLINPLCDLHTLQVVRKGLDRVTAAAVLERYKEDVADSGQEGGGKSKDLEVGIKVKRRRSKVME